jgi:pimeloyl-ACP methyl ester carboxylesterase
MATADAKTPVETGYAPLNGLRMYYEIYGEGRPLILLHGAYMTIDTMGPILPGFAATRQVIAVEQQGHGHTADIDRPITYEQMADDTAALLQHLGVDNADIVGFSMGGGIALQLAIRQPAVVRKLVVASATYTSDGMHAVAVEMFPSITPELFAGRRSKRHTCGRRRTPTTSQSWSRSSSNSIPRRSLGWPTIYAGSPRQP